MVEVVSRGIAEITIIDLTDNKRIMSYIQADKVRQVIYNPDDNTFLPNYSVNPITLSPQLKLEGSTENIINRASRVKWFYQENSINELVEITDTTLGNTYELLSEHRLKIKSNVLSSALSYKYYCEITYINGEGEELTFLTDFELFKLYNGSSANDTVIGYLTNDNDLVPTDVEGAGGDYSQSRSEMVIYEGTKDVTSAWKIDITVSNGVIGSKIGNNGYQITSIADSEDKGSVTFTATKQGVNKIITKVYSVTKIKNASLQEIYKISPAVTVIRKNADGDYLPNTLDIDAYKKKGKEPYDKYLGYIRVLYSNSYDGDLSNYREAYKSTNPENKINYTIPENISAIRLELYSDPAMTNMLDFQSVPVVVENKVTATPVITTPNGTVLRNSKGELKAMLTLYKGSDIVTADEYRWYLLNPQAVGDIYSGTGWTSANSLDEDKITIRNNEITVKASGINGNETFMCIAELDGLKYKVTVTFTDLQDDYIVTIIGSGIFKNGRGSNTYVCKVHSKGEEIDVNGDKYSYTWSMYNSSGHLMQFSKTSKRITVTSEEINNKAVLTCTVEEK